MNMHAKITPATATLAQLKPGSEYPGGNINARLTYTQDEIEELAASLKGPDGQLRPLLVATHSKKPGTFFVFGGGRRRMAFELLITRGDLPKDYPIEIVSHGEITPEQALSRSYADNQAVPMHPADQAVTFAQLAADRAPEDIAKERGMTVRAVQQSITLGTALAPEVLASWRAGKISREAVQVLVLAPIKLQVESLEDVERDNGRHYGHALRDLKAEITRNKEDLMTRLLGFVGVQDARAAGIAVTEDFFGAGGVVQDLAALEKLANRSMAALVKAEKEAGWSWVDGKTTVHRSMHHGMGEAKAKPEYTADEKKRLAEIEAELKAYDSLEDTTSEQDRAEELLSQEKEDLEIAAKARAFTDKQKAGAGVKIRLRADGSVFYQRGLIEKKETKKASPSHSAAAPARAQEQPPITRAAREAIGEWHNKTMSAMLEKRPRDSATLFMANLFYDGYAGLGDIDSYGVAGRSKDLTALLAKFKKMSDSQLVASLAPVMLKNLDIVSHDGSLDKPGIALVEFVGAKEYQARLSNLFDPKTYFAGASKKHLLGFMAEAFGELPRQHAEDKTEAELVKIFVAEIGRTGWLPPEMRTKAYTGPTAKAPAGPKSAKKKAR